MIDDHALQVTTEDEQLLRPQDRIGAVLALVDGVLAAHPDDGRTHHFECHHDHASCLAHRIRTILEEGESNG